VAQIDFCQQAAFAPARLRRSAIISRKAAAMVDSSSSSREM
jgi:hypothetical protein